MGETIMQHQNVMWAVLIILYFTMIATAVTIFYSREYDDEE